MSFLKVETHVIGCLCGINEGWSTGFHQYHVFPVAESRQPEDLIASSVPLNFSLYQVINLALTLARKGNVCLKAVCYSLNDD